MIPHSHAMDSLARAQDLASAVLAASSPPQIAAACSAVDAFLHKHPPDQSRSFFSVVFPALICKLFGFEDSSSASFPLAPNSRPGWIDHPEADLGSRAFDLLSPNGILFSTIASVDRHSLVKYVFPIERLPEWMRHVLQNDRYSAVLPDLCPLFKSRVKKDPVQGCLQLQLNVYEYYMFWFAYYPVCKGSWDNSSSGVVRKSPKSRLESWTSSLPSLSGGKRQVGKKMECSLYLRLLYAYLHAFVPKCGIDSYQPYRSSLLHYSSSYDGSSVLQAAFVVNTFVHFWMVDNDFSPLPVSLCNSFGVSFPIRKLLGENPPSAGLGEVLKLLVKYLNSGMIGSLEGNAHVDASGTSAWGSSGPREVWKLKSGSVPYENLSGSWNLLVQRPLYRFILRTLLFCPMGTSIKNASQVFSLWTSYLEPWKISQEDFVEFDSSVSQNQNTISREACQPLENGKTGFNCEPVFTHFWHSYVLSNYLFYSSLVVHFLGFAHKFLHTDPETIIQMALKVMNILTSSKELMDLLKKIDAAYHSKNTGSSSAVVDSSYKCIPSIREQLQDWEDGLYESEADGSFLHENWNHNLKLFSENEDGAHQLLQFLILRAKPEIQSISADNELKYLQNLEYLRAQTNILFSGAVRRANLPVSDCFASPQQHGRDEVFTPKHPGIGKLKWADVKYQGDWMRRPISDSEVAWLARHLIRLSDLLNDFLGLNRNGDHQSAGPTYIEIPPLELEAVHGVKDAAWMILSAFSSWVWMLIQVTLGFLRGRGWRVNLRVLASKKVVMMVLVYIVVTALRKAFWVVVER